MIVRRLVGGLIRTTIHIVGLAAILGIWDYTQQAKAAEYDYGFEDYPPSVVARYGDEIGYLTGAVQMGLQGVSSGARKVAQSGMLEKLGIEDHLAFLSGDIAPRPVAETGTMTVAAAQPALAPDASLFPQARSNR